MIREADIGFVVANGDLASARSALWEAREDPGRLKRMGENAARLLRDHFSLAQASSEYLQVILEHMPPSIDGPAAEPLTEHWAVPPRPTDDAV